MWRSWPSRLRAAFAPMCLAALVAATALAQPTHVLLVLDASGSMYLRLEDGQYRIAAAKDALSEFVTRLPDDPDLSVGLRVHGSRLVAIEDGACEDSELVVPVEGFAREILLASIRATQAKGATPIAYSLELAADDLRDAVGHKVVVLVTDGAASCGGDVRSAVERLTAAGFDVDVRIIGFALSEYAVASFAGLGTFENTNSAAELAAALGRAIEVAPSTASYRVTVALTRRGEPAGDGATVRYEGAPGGAGHGITIVPAGAAEGTYLSWAYTSRGSPTTLTAPREPGAYEVRYVLGQDDRTLARVTVTVR